MKRSVFILLVVIQCAHGYAQSVLHGVVTDGEDSKPVPYVSIGITTKPNGTVSNSAGVFSIALNNTISNGDTLKFSSIGYQDQAFLIGDLKEQLRTGPLTIQLKKSLHELAQVSIVAKKLKEKVAGYETSSKLLGVGFGANEIGSQGGIIIPVKHPATNIQNISFFIIQNSFTHLTLRMNIYELADGRPGRNILNNNVLLQIADRQTGKVTFDLSSYNIYLNSDALITLEWLDARPAAKGSFAVSAVIFGHSYFRQASQYAWTKKGIGLGISVKTGY